MQSIFENSDVGQGFSQEKKESFYDAYLRVILIEHYGKMHTIWLPNTIEGHYQFGEDTKEGGGLPVYIEGEHGQWVVHTEKDAVFHTADNRECTEKVLADNMMIKIYDHGSAYILFAEMERVSDHQFVFYELDERMEYMIGRKPDCQICYPRETVSRDHALLKKSGQFWYIIDQDSANGVYFNGRRVKSARLHNGDIIFIMGLYLLAGPGFLAVNNKNGRIRMQSSGIQCLDRYHDFHFLPYQGLMDNGVFDRQPHKQLRISPEPIEIEMPPMPLYANKIPFLLRMGSPMVMGGRAFMTGNFAMALTSLIFPALTQGITEKDRKEYEEKRTGMYRKYLADKAMQIRHEKNQEEQMLNKSYPELSNALRYAITKERLWERQKRDDDFLKIRIGTGSYPMIAEKKFEEKRLELERDHLEQEMYQLAESLVMLEHVPVMLSLRTDPLVGVLGSVQQMEQLLVHMVMQLALTHSYDEVKLVLLLDRERAGAFDFARYLPHSWDNDRSIRFFAVSQSDALLVGEYLSKEWETLQDKDRHKQAAAMPAYVVFACSKRLFACVEVFKELLSKNESSNFSIVAAFDGIPKECSKMVDLRDGMKLIDLAQPQTEEQAFVLDACDKQLAKDGMRALMRTKLKMDSQAYRLPDMMTFLEMYGVGRVEHLSPLKRWQDNNPVKSLAARIGVGTDGRPFMLDLHEKRQGPHGLVAGMTGSGKSEFLITYILSMAVNYSPDEVAFILIDYKGGGLADAFEDKEKGIRLPHLVGTVTNLDGACVQRSLMSIKSELMRRQRVFKEAKAKTKEGTMDIYDYQRLYRNKKVEEPMPHLFIISDEFAELKQQQQEFMDELISAARIGRSLGVHLILATQKPGGVVNDQIWSNTRFRVCLRVQDRGDSMEMLKRPEAAELKHTGRFYLQVGYHEFFALGQSAWCGSDYIPQEELAEDQDYTVQFLDHTGQTILDVKPAADHKQAKGKQIVAIVSHLSDIAIREGRRPGSLWQEPLPKMLELDGLLKQVSWPKDQGIYALIGMVDDPEYQRQFPLFLPFLDFHNMLLVGASGSGKSTFIRTMLYTLTDRYSPAEVSYYLLDLSDHALSGYGKTAHCGAYLTEENEKDIGRFLEFIHTMIGQRKKMFAKMEVSDFDVYRKIELIPLILVVVDGFMNIRGLNGGEEYFIMFQNYLRDGAAVGIRFILTCNHDNEVGAKSKQELDYRIALQAKDRYEYTDILDVRCVYAPSQCNGRGMCVYEGRSLEYHTAMLDGGQPQQEQAGLLRERLARMMDRYAQGKSAKRFPMPDFDQSYRAFSAGFSDAWIPLGYSLTDMKTVAIPLQQLHSMSVYFGNPNGVAAVFENLFTAADNNHMDVWAVRRRMVLDDGRTAGSILDVNAEQCASRGFQGNLTVFDCTAQGLSNLSDRIRAEVKARNVYSDEYSIRQGIPLERRGRAKKAARYIREKTAPIWIMIESFADFCKICKEQEQGGESELEGLYQIYFQKMQGYNLYFAAGFYPEDDKMMSHSPLLEAYNPYGFLLLFGGRYGKALIPDLPYEITKTDAVEPRYNRFWMKYREAFYPMVMPCGQLQADVEEEDEADII